MRTNVVLDDELIVKAFKYSHAKTKRELIDEALRELIASRQRLDIRDLRGKVEFEKDYDYKKMRKAG